MVVKPQCLKNISETSMSEKLTLVFMQCSTSLVPRPFLGTKLVFNSLTSVSLVIQAALLYK